MFFPWEEAHLTTWLELLLSMLFDFAKKANALILLELHLELRRLKQMVLHLYQAAVFVDWQLTVVVDTAR